HRQFSALDTHMARYTHYFTDEYRKYSSFDTKLDPYCGGHLCTKCGKCSDWRYVSNNTNDWQWISNWKNWRKDDWDRWYRYRFWEDFERHRGSTCHYGPYDPHHHYTGLVYHDLGSNACLCDTIFERRKW
ncbi:unnamed protein product, partial [Rotaria sp. Silwood1]